MNRRGFITGTMALLTAPAIVRASSLGVLPRGTPLYPRLGKNLVSYWTFEGKVIGFEQWPDCEYFTPVEYRNGMWSSVESTSHLAWPDGIKSIRLSAAQSRA